MIGYSIEIFAYSDNSYHYGYVCRDSASRKKVWWVSEWSE